MSDQEKSEILKFIEAGKAVDRKWNIYKIITAIACTFITIFGAGAWFGDWRTWRVDVDKDRSEFWQYMRSGQSVKNEVQAQHNKSVVFKNYQP